jgi:nucleoside-diphosphate-sugar epimerase
VDLKYPEFAETPAADFRIGDLRDASVCRRAADHRFDEVYQLAADTGGAAYVHTGENDACVLHNSALIDLNILGACYRQGIHRVFYASSASIYPQYKQLDPEDGQLDEEAAYPAQPDGEQGWGKLFAERAYLAFHRSCGMAVRIARLHNVFGPQAPWQGGRENAPAALCRKVAQAEEGGALEVWGDGHQTRSFLYIDECIEGVLRLMRSGFTGPVNLGSDEMVAIDELARMVMEVAGKPLDIHHVEGPLGVRGRNSHNRLIEQKLGWRPRAALIEGLRRTYPWVAEQVEQARQRAPDPQWIAPLVSLRAARVP